MHSMRSSALLAVVSMLPSSVTVCSTARTAQMNSNAVSYIRTIPLQLHSRDNLSHLI